MINYGAKPTNQIEFMGLGQSGEDVMDKARRWVDAHEEDFERYLRLARRQVARSKDGKASPNACKEQLRGGFDVNYSFGGDGVLTCDESRCVSIPNVYSPALARIAMERDRSLDFRIAKSKVDGFVDVKLDRGTTC